MVAERVVYCRYLWWYTVMVLGVHLVYQVVAVLVVVGVVLV